VNLKRIIMKENKDLNKNRTTGSPSPKTNDRSETRNDINTTPTQDTSDSSGAGFGTLSETVGGRGAGSGSGLSHKTGRTGSDTDGQVS
jgi:hypothetical protein